MATPNHDPHPCTRFPRRPEAPAPHRRRRRRSPAPSPSNRSRKRWFAAAVLVLLAALIFADHRGLLLHRRDDDWRRFHNRIVTVTRVIDGDTIDIALLNPRNPRSPHHPATTTRVRFIGIDCPELARDNRPAEPFAQQAADMTRNLIADNPVRLILERHNTRGTFGRLLAHVELDTGPCLNEALLAAGLAVTEERWPHARLRPPIPPKSPPSSHAAC